MTRKRCISGTQGQCERKMISPKIAVPNGFGSIFDSTARLSHWTTGDAIASRAREDPGRDMATSRVCLNVESVHAMRWRLPLETHIPGLARGRRTMRTIEVARITRACKIEALHGCEIPAFCISFLDIAPTDCRESSHCSVGWSMKPTSVREFASGDPDGHTAA